MFFDAKHIRHNNMQGNYNMFNQQLSTTEQQWDNNKYHNADIFL